MIGPKHSTFLLLNVLHWVDGTIGQLLVQSDTHAGTPVIHDSNGAKVFGSPVSDQAHFIDLI